MLLKKVAEIENTPYGVWGENRWISCEPLKDKIDKAFKEKNFDKRSFQGNEAELIAEWNKGASCFEEFRVCAENYHARRIAYFASKERGEPIILLNNEKKISDGLHRLKAAIYLGLEEVEVIILPDNGGARWTCL